MKPKFLRAIAAHLLICLTLAFAGFAGFHIHAYLLPVNADSVWMFGLMLIVTLGLFLIDMIALEWAYDRKLMPDFIGRIADWICRY